MSSSITRHDNNFLFKGTQLTKPVFETKLDNIKELALKKEIKVIKTGKQDVNYVITRHKSVGLAIMNICDIIIYDVPAV